MKRGILIGFVASLLIPVLIVPVRAQEYSFTYTCEDQGDIMHPDSLGLFYSYLTNTGAEADTYQVVIDKDLPVPWLSIACLNDEICFLDQIAVPLESGSSMMISVKITPLGFPGAGTVTMRVTSRGDTTQAAALPMTAITNTGVDVLIVDDDGDQVYETYYQAALDSAGKSHGTLDKATAVIDADRLAPFSAVMWFTGEAAPALTAEDRGAISGYLDGGGRLFISGQDIASALCDPAGGESDSSTVAWFENTFSAAYEGEYDGTLAVGGAAGSSISDGLTLSLSGGDGAGNQAAPDILDPLFGATAFACPVFHYEGFPDGPGMAAFTISTGTYRVAYLGFGFEAIDNAADRELLMDRIMDYFSGPTRTEDDPAAGALPRDLSLSPGYPNPFNAVTALAIDVPGDEPATVTLRIYNVLGQEVRTLLDGPVLPGSRVLFWDGTDNAGAGLASGVYFARMASGTFSQTRKIVLTR